MTEPVIWNKNENGLAKLALNENYTGSPHFLTFLGDKEHREPNKSWGKWTSNNEKSPQIPSNPLKSPKITLNLEDLWNENTENIQLKRLPKN